MEIKVSKLVLSKVLDSISTLLKPKEVEEAIRIKYNNGKVFIEQSHSIFYRADLDAEVRLEDNEVEPYYIYRYKDIRKLIECDTSDTIFIKATESFVYFKGNEIETSLPASRAQLAEFPDIKYFKEQQIVSLLDWRSSAKDILNLKLFGEHQTKKSLIFINNGYMYQHFDICFCYFKTNLKLNAAYTELVLSQLVEILQPEVQYSFEEETEKQKKETVLDVSISTHKSDTYFKYNFEEIIAPSVKEHKPRKLAIEEMTEKLSMSYQDFRDIMDTVKNLPEVGKFDLFISDNKAYISINLIEIDASVKKTVNLSKKYQDFDLTLNRKYFKILDKVIHRGSEIVNLQKGDRIWKLVINDLTIFQSIQR